jgi:hypothetical protein
MHIDDGDAAKHTTTAKSASDPVSAYATFKHVAADNITKQPAGQLSAVQDHTECKC